jgi:nitrite reductase (NADH) large subunit
VAGARCVEEILARGGADQFEITMFGEEPHGNYNRILLSDVLNGSHDEADIYLNPLPWYEQHQIQLFAGVRAVSILRSARQVIGENGVTVPYDQLILATGSVPFLPPIEGLRLPDGAFKPGVFVFRNLDDCRKISRYALGKRKGAVIGGGLLGLEAARGLQNFELEVHVVHLASHLMNTQLDSQAGAILSSTLQELGMHVHVGVNTKAVIGEERVTGLLFSDGRSIDCDVCVVSAGIKPHVELAVRAGLSVERGIVVDNQLRTPDDPRIFALGECVQHRGQIYGLVAPLWEQAKVLAEHLTGVNPQAAYHGSKVATRLEVMGVEVASMGITEPTQEGDEVVQFTEPKKGTYKKLIIRNGRSAGQHPARRHQQVRVPDGSLRARDAAAGGAALAAVRSGRPCRQGDLRGDGARHASVQLQRREQARAGRVRALRPAHGQGGDGADARRYGLRRLQGPGERDRGLGLRG